MKIRKVILLVDGPTFEEVGKMGLGFSDSLSHLESCAFLQERLAGVWEVQDTGRAVKFHGGVDYTDAGEVLQITLGKPLELGMLRVHYKHVYENNPTTNVDTPICEFITEGYPDGHYSKLTIGAKKVNESYSIAYAFS